ncbi:uncharacterized protein LOC129045163 [Pongo pygmaeus]|uniref:uncharacterized protein LOC129045163 n=1 Tax=Pongo pygmaeus TaxID=9600 RepID=UPI0023E24A9E|nr:uncharacterized protein LOC129045163 [Pongo pygmaeus]XP_054396627.1 uncharacterized protein LOC112130148 [Pongo abelii]
MFPTRASSFPLGRPPRSDPCKSRESWKQVPDQEGRRRRSRYREMIRCFHPFRFFQLVVKVTSCLEARGDPDLGAAPMGCEADSFLGVTPNRDQAFPPHQSATLALEIPRAREGCKFSFLNVTD